MCCVNLLPLSFKTASSDPHIDSSLEKRSQNSRTTKTNKTTQSHMDLNPKPVMGNPK